MRIFCELFLERATEKRRINYVNVKTFLIPSVHNFSRKTMETSRQPTTIACFENQLWWLVHNFWRLILMRIFVRSYLCTFAVIIFYCQSTPRGLLVLVYMKTKVADSNRLCSQIWLGQLRNKDVTTKSIKIFKRICTGWKYACVGAVCQDIWWKIDILCAASKAPERCIRTLK